MIVVYYYNATSLEPIEDLTACELRYAECSDCVWIVPGTYEEA